VIALLLGASVAASWMFPKKPATHSAVGHPPLASEIRDGERED
jgi:hypothetical protein